MNKRLILLILILPLFLMLSIYTATSNVALNISAPVTDIKITGNDFVYLSLDKGEKYFVNYAIYPLSATNKNVIFETEQVGNQMLAELEYVDGYIVPKSIGVAKVYLSTVDGGFKDSFVVYVESLSLQAISSSVATANLLVGKTTQIQTVFMPETFSNKLLSYKSSNDRVASVDDKGVIKALTKGSATITVTSVADETIQDVIVINVYNQNIMDLSASEVTTYKTSGEISLSIDCEEEYSLDYKVYDINNEELLTEDVFVKDLTGFEQKSVDNVEYNSFVYTFIEGFKDEIIVKITITTADGVRNPLTKECLITKVDQISAEFDNADKVIYTTALGAFFLHDEMTITPSDADVSYEVTFSNTNLSKSVNGKRVTIFADLPGITMMTVTVTTNTLPRQSVTISKEVVIAPTNIAITQQTKTYGIEKKYWTVGKYEADGSPNTSALTLNCGKTAAGERLDECITYETNNPNVQVFNDGTIVVLNEDFTGLVDVVAVFSYPDCDPIYSLACTIRCVGNGYNVRSFSNLYNITKQSKVVVLQNTIKEDFGEDSLGNLVYTEQTVDKISTTYDTTHYKNLNKLDEAKVKVLISFKADVYGNGYEINSGNVAYGLDTSGSLKQDALFKGPLNFVSMSESESSMVSVKAQDNISFAVYEDVTLSNVVLKSCDPLNQSGEVDLRELTYVGTTVEVLGDNVNIEYSRISNGRTVLRAFGDILDSQKVINLNIKNSVLSCAREFILRIGSNHFVNGTTENPSPYIGEDTTKTFPAQKSYSQMTSEEKLAYEEAYIKTFVNLKNTIMEDSGLFCVGLDSHFSGAALADGTGIANGLIGSWHDLAKTSYGAKLTFDGDVRMYDWKVIDNIDSSTLIESLESSSYSDLSFDIRGMVEKIAANTEKPHLQAIVKKYKDKDYVHGGIAFFGGGKNYGVFEQKGNQFRAFDEYEISLADVGKELLELAAGSESFYFMLNSTSFSPEEQDSLTAPNGNGYNIIYN